MNSYPSPALAPSLPPGPALPPAQLVTGPLPPRLTSHLRELAPPTYRWTDHPPTGQKIDGPASSSEAY